MSTKTPFDPRLDLRLQRVVDVPRREIWRAWTEPARLMPWFCPRPWTVVDCEIELRPGGLFRTTMQSPEGQQFPNLGCYLEVVDQERLAWTNAMAPGFRPTLPAAIGGHEDAHFLFTAVIELADEGPGTRYTATCLHADEAGRNRHAAMGFEAGWSMALDQLVAMVKQGH